MLKEVFLYSVYCKKVKNKPQVIVITKPITVEKISLLIKALCDHVKLIPEDKSIIVFKNGKCHKLIISIPTGGHTAPIQIEGANEE